MGLRGGAAERLWQKSAIGRPNGEGKLELSPAETLFVHYHRHIDLPTNDWMNTALNQNPMLLQEYSILEALRVPGNKIVLSQNMGYFLIKFTLSLGLLDGLRILIQEIVKRFPKYDGFMNPINWMQ